MTAPRVGDGHRWVGGGLDPAWCVKCQADILSLAARKPCLGSEQR